MRFALISPTEPVSDGFRVCEVALAVFDVAPPLFWVACDSTIEADVFYYNVEQREFLHSPPPPDIPEHIANRVANSPQPVVSGAQTL